MENSNITDEDSVVMTWFWTVEKLEVELTQNQHLNYFCVPLTLSSLILHAVCLCE